RSGEPAAAVLTLVRFVWFRRRARAGGRCAAGRQPGDVSRHRRKTAGWAPESTSCRCRTGLRNRSLRAAAPSQVGSAFGTAVGSAEGLELGRVQDSGAGG